MYFVLGYFALHGNVADDARLRLVERAEQALAPVVPESYVRHRYEGPGWGVLAGHSADWNRLRWPLTAQDGDVTAVSFGIPVGADPAARKGAVREKRADPDMPRGPADPRGRGA
ncbi:hypothetical protein [Catellatospora paridis]|uniref:hypothetical protein n=1 Tax=Catellatospora paridis TaxID=1617086 RepID=UPI0012D3932C|nr:hypothetical protein [Catellatospora paridis]